MNRKTNRRTERSVTKPADFCSNDRGSESFTVQFKMGGVSLSAPLSHFCFSFFPFKELLERAKRFAIFSVPCDFNLMTEGATLWFFDTLDFSINTQTLRCANQYACKSTYSPYRDKSFQNSSHLLCDLCWKKYYKQINKRMNNKLVAYSMCTHV